MLTNILHRRLVPYAGETLGDYRNGLRKGQSTSDNLFTLRRIFFPHSRTVHLDTIKVFYLPTDAQENCFKKNIKIYIKTCFVAITIIREGII
jgi:hypothetical protein